MTQFFAIVKCKEKL